MRRRNNVKGFKIKHHEQVAPQNGATWRAENTHFTSGNTICRRQRTVKILRGNTTFQVGPHNGARKKGGQRFLGKHHFTSGAATPGDGTKAQERYQNWRRRSAISAHRANFPSKSANKGGARIHHARGRESTFWLKKEQIYNTQRQRATQQ